MAELVWERARREARSILDLHQTNDPYVICEDLGISVEASALPPGVSGMIVKSKDEDAQIFVDITDVPARQHFTVAHELGHFVERTNVARDEVFSFRDERGASYNLHEFFADEFAGALLMPEKEILTMVEQGATPTQLARHFAVSTTAVEKRLERLRKNP